MIWLIGTIIYLLVGGIIFFGVALTDEYNPERWIPTFILTVFLWPLIFLAWGVAALAR